jgi:RNA polymerase sigma-70 factor (ECF subfamily)
MTELDLIRSFRADVPAPSAAAGARADRAWRRAEPRRPRWAPRAAVAGAVVAAVTAGALILPSERETRLGAQPASAAETLRHAAAVDPGGLARPLRPGEYWYIRRRTMWATGGHKYGGIQPEIREDWVGSDGSRHWRTRPDGPPRFAHPEQLERWEADGRPAFVGPSEFRTGPSKGPFHYGARQVTYAELLELPRDPEALYQRMRAAAMECECGQSVEQETLDIAGALVRDNPIPADLRAAILRATALVPGIELVDDVRDVAGRKGVGVAFDGPGWRSVLIFDPQTYELLGENEGAGGSADMESGIVDSLDAIP